MSESGAVAGAEILGNINPESRAPADGVLGLGTLLLKDCKLHRYILNIFVLPSQSNNIAQKSAFKPKRGHESTTGIHLINE